MSTFSDPAIYAAGDIANAFHPLLGKHIRIKHWFNALSQPAVAAKSMLGLAAAYDEVPYFYSDQYELVIEYSGHVAPGGYNEAVFRGDKDQLKCIVFWLKDHKVLAAMNINVWDQTDTIKTLVRSGQPVDTAALADTGTPLADVLAATGTPNAQKSGADRTGPES